MIIEQYAEGRSIAGHKIGTYLHIVTFIKGGRVVNNSLDLQKWEFEGSSMGDIGM